MLRSPLLAALCSLSVLPVACSDSAGTTQASSAASSTSGAGGSSSTQAASVASSTSSASSGAGGSACDTPSNPGDGANVVVDTIDATVTDTSGAPLATLPVQLCGLNLCTNAKTDQNGHVSIAAAGKSFSEPTFKYGDGLTFAKFATPVRMATMTVTPAITVALPKDGPSLAAGSEATSGDVTLALDPSTMIEIDTLIYDTPSAQQFRAARLETAMLPAAVDPALGLEVVYGAGPLETTFCPAAKLRVPNTAKWPAGTAVEVFVHGLDGGEVFAPYGGWAKASDATVTADGTTVETDAGQGLRVLSTFALRKKP